MPASASTGASTGFGSLSNVLSGGMNFLNGSSISAGASGMWTRAGDFMATSSNNTMAGMGDFMQANPQIGSYLGMAGNAMAGYGLGKFANSTISNGYQISSGMTTFQNVGAAVAGALAGPLGGAIAGAVSGLVNRAFGRGPKEIQQSGVMGSFSGGGVTGNLFQDWRREGGWFRSDKSGTDLSDMTAEISTALGAGAASILSQTQLFAAALKLPGENLAQITTDFRVVLTGNAEEDQAAISAALESYGEALTAGFSDALAPFQRAGESLIETMQRLSILETFSQSINELGGIFSSIAGSSVEARESLIGMAGGIDALIGKAASFVQNYYSADEQAGMQAKAIQDALAAAGLTASELASAGIRGDQAISREDFRALVESRDVETELGREQLMALLNVGESFAGLSDYMEETGQTFNELIEAAPQVAVLQSILSPTEVTAEATQAVATSIEISNTLLTTINDSIVAGAAATTAAVAQVAAAASAAASAASAAAAAAADAASLASSQPSYQYNIGGGA
jgi:hypothetical protein